jgi:hypothetical protein
MFMAIDQYGQTYHGLKHPRKDLCKKLCRQHVAKMFVDKKDGSSVWIGYIIGRLWLTLYKVERMERSV